MLLASSRGQCIDNHRTDGVGLYPCIGTAPQTWTLSLAGEIRQDGTALCLTAQTHSTVVAMSPCAHTEAQQWRFVPAPGRRGWGFLQLHNRVVCISHAHAPLQLGACDGRHCRRLFLAVPRGPGPVPPLAAV